MKTKIFFLLITLGLTQLTDAQHQQIINSNNLSKPDTVWTFTPNNYNPSQSYPLIFLLHGWSGNYHQWDDIMDCQTYADQYEFIIVCPDGIYDSWYINSPAIKNSQYQSFFFAELFPEILKKYKVDTSNIFITGLSMGGHGALYLFEQNPNFFRNAGSISGVVDLAFSKNDYNISKYLGLTGEADDSSILAKYSVNTNIDKIKSAGKEIIFSCGTEDPFYSINKAFKEKCDELQIKATYITDPGAHNYEYWAKAIQYQFLFFSNKVYK